MGFRQNRTPLMLSMRSKISVPLPNATCQQRWTPVLPVKCQVGQNTAWLKKGGGGLRSDWSPSFALLVFISFPWTPYCVELFDFVAAVKFALISRAPLCVPLVDWVPNTEHCPRPWDFGCTFRPAPFCCRVNGTLARPEQTQGPDPSCLWIKPI